MKKWGKRLLAVALAAVLIAGLAAGGLYWRKSSAEAVNVYSVAELAMTDYWEDMQYTYGSVTTDQTQSVYLSSTQTVQEVLVTEGQSVSKGDVLMTYDTTLSEVEVEKKDLEIQQLELDLETAKKNLEKVKTYKAGAVISEKNQVDLSGNLFGVTGRGAENDTATEVIAADTDKKGSTQTEAEMGLLSAATASAAESSEISVNTKTIGALSTSWSGTAALRVLARSLSALQPGDDVGTEPSEESTEAGTSGDEETGGNVSGSPEESSEEIPTTEEPMTEVPATENPTADVPTTETPTTEAPTAEEPTTIAPTTETPEETSAAEDGYPELVDGKGKKNKPYIYNWDAECVFTQDFLAYLCQGKKKAYVVLQVEEGASYWKLRITRSGGEYRFEMLELCVDGVICDLTETETEAEEESGDDIFGGDSYGGDFYESGGVTYTAAEIAEMRSSLEEQIRDLDLEIRTAKVELTRLETELSGSSVVSQIDGVITAVRDADESKVNNESFIDVSGGGGYYVTASVSELELGEISLGQTMSLTSMESGTACEGKVVEISEYPDENSYYYGSGNNNVSLYPFTLFIEEGAGLQEYEYMEITYGSDTADGDTFYLMNFMVRTENGSSYVYVRGEDGTLEKRTVRTGRNLWGSYTEIESGLSLEDAIAFPYGSDVKEGASTQEGSVNDDLYNY
ncbi:MAG: biotin/lipoyl-binding protein [Lachnospiraceae bacterium]|nr:biotin/lipoyl-binding protein [Lachnospiraceae bacterium]